MCSVQSINNFSIKGFAEENVPVDVCKERRPWPDCAHACSLVKVIAVGKNYNIYTHRNFKFYSRLLVHKLAKKYPFFFSISEYQSRGPFLWQNGSVLMQKLIVTLFLVSLQTDTFSALPERALYSRSQHENYCLLSGWQWLKRSSASCYCCRIMEGRDSCLMGVFANRLVVLSSACTLSVPEWILLFSAWENSSFCNMRLTKIW